MTARGRCESWQLGSQRNSNNRIPTFSHIPTQSSYHVYENNIYDMLIFVRTITLRLSCRGIFVYNFLVRFFCLKLDLLRIFVITLLLYICAQARIQDFTQGVGKIF